jgi:hypothetical protein
MVGDRFSARKKGGGSGLIYFVLAILFVFFMIKWGVPGFINFLAGPSGEKGGGLKQSEDIVPPQTPTFAALPEATNSGRVRVEGYTESEVDVSIYKNDELASTARSDTDGKFEFELSLSDGSNRIYVKARDAAGNESQSVPETVNLDTKAVDLTITSPADGAEFFGKDKQNITVLGEATKTNVSVTVNGSYARVDTDGKFSTTIRLNKGENQIAVRAVDRAGNSAEKTIKVKLIF